MTSQSAVAVVIVQFDNDAGRQLWLDSFVDDASCSGHCCCVCCVADVAIDWWCCYCCCYYCDFAAMTADGVAAADPLGKKR